MRAREPAYRCGHASNYLRQACEKRGANDQRGSSRRSRATAPRQTQLTVSRMGRRARRGIDVRQEFGRGKEQRHDHQKCEQPPARAAMAHEKRWRPARGERRRG